MVDSNKLRELDDLISDMELNQERAHVMAFIIDQNYFDLDEDSFKLHYFQNASIEHDILFDYVVANVELLNKAREMLNGGIELCRK